MCFCDAHRRCPNAVSHASRCKRQTAHWQSRHAPLSARGQPTSGCPTRPLSFLCMLSGPRAVAAATAIARRYTIASRSSVLVKAVAAPHSSQASPRRHFAFHAATMAAAAGKTSSAAVNGKGYDEHWQQPTGTPMPKLKVWNSLTRSKVSWDPSARVGRRCTRLRSLHGGSFFRWTLCQPRERTLPGELRRPPLRDLLTKEKLLFLTRSLRLLSRYNCGPTVYDASHMGHARCATVRLSLLGVKSDPPCAAGTT